MRGSGELEWDCRHVLAAVANCCWRAKRNCTPAHPGAQGCRSCVYDGSSGAERCERCLKGYKGYMAQWTPINVTCEAVTPGTSLAHCADYRYEPPPPFQQRRLASIHPIYNWCTECDPGFQCR